MGSIRRRTPCIYKRRAHFSKVFDVFVENVQRDGLGMIGFDLWCVVENNRYCKECDRCGIIEALFLSYGNANI